LNNDLLFLTGRDSKFLRTWQWSMLFSRTWLREVCYVKQAFQTNLRPSSHVIRVAAARPETYAHSYNNTHRQISITPLYLVIKLRTVCDFIFWKMMGRLIIFRRFKRVLNRHFPAKLETLWRRPSNTPLNKVHFRCVKVPVNAEWRFLGFRMQVMAHRGRAAADSPYSASSLRHLVVVIHYICTLMAYYAACSGNSLPTFRYNLLGPIFKSQESKSLIYSPLKIGPIGCPETSVRNYQYTLRKIGPIGCPETSVRNYQYTLRKIGLICCS
jgi:hypothetical protein